MPPPPELLSRHCRRWRNALVIPYSAMPSSSASSSITAALEAKYERLEVLKHRALAPLHTKLRDRTTSHAEFKFYADRLMRILAEEGLASCASEHVTVTTPTGDEYAGPVFADRICAVSVIRAGDSLLQAVLDCDPRVAVGKILIQRDESTDDKRPVFYYAKLPPKMSSYDHVLVVDPMLGTGGSITTAIKKLVEVGVEEHKITFLNVVSCPEGIERLMQEFPDVRVMTAALDPCMNDDKYITPGLGDYGDRYYNTVHH
ncbi:TPA: hypothetical protein N0F65_000674 [Lagenidium giganteum]|uniref:uracil phosphoribosyltransferase n=1 Tax=Lagenidium giganteum TaxID=4803 RepID=A0AAV2YW39_9STRA|nr:TPA: hypothetical protein N0F65_000674 [Lagenidium giganteum]